MYTQCAVSVIVLDPILYSFRPFFTIWPTLAQNLSLWADWDVGKALLEADSSRSTQYYVIQGGCASGSPELLGEFQTLLLQLFLTNGSRYGRSFDAAGRMLAIHGSG